MVNVGEKPESLRSAVAAGRVLLNRQTFDLIKSGGMKKGDVLTVAQIAGIMGAKRTAERNLKFKRSFCVIASIPFSSLNIILFTVPLPVRSSME
jgi:hypothetical protein